MIWIVPKASVTASDRLPAELWCHGSKSWIQWRPGFVGGAYWDKQSDASQWDQTDSHWIFHSAGQQHSLKLPIPDPTGWQSGVWATDGCNENMLKGWRRGRLHVGWRKLWFTTAHSKEQLQCFLFYCRSWFLEITRNKQNLQRSHRLFFNNNFRCSEAGKFLTTHFIDYSHTDMNLFTIFSLVQTFIGKEIQYYRLKTNIIFANLIHSILSRWGGG